MRPPLAVLLSLLALTPCLAEITLTADTSRPEMSLFTPTEPVTLTFAATGLTAADAGLRLQLEIVDEHERSLAKAELPVEPGGGAWQGTYEAPHDHLGFYRVRVKLSNGVTLPKLGSRAPGYLTYAVVPDPAARPLYPSTETFYGMQGGFSNKVNVLPWLGIRWVLGGYGWKDLEPDHAGQFAEKLAQRRAQEQPPVWHVGGKPWVTYAIPTFMMAPKWAVKPETAAYSTGTPTAEGEVAWRQYVANAAKAYAAEHPELTQHVYQITWEPVYPWGFKGSDEDLIRIYALAYPAIHAADPRAVVIGPTGGGSGPSDVEWNATLLRKGLAKYLDGFGIHPYHPLPPERTGLVDHLREIKEAILQSAGHDLPLYGTEQGFATGEDPAKELLQEQGLLRAHLIMAGEGFRVNFGFYIADYWNEPGYGYSYNLNPKIAWGTDKIAPKPVAAGFAAQTFLLEGHRTTGPIEWLGETALGYGFERGDHVVLAVWDWGDTPRPVSLPVGVAQVTVYDHMGNRREVATPDGALPLTLTGDPQYVAGVAPALWGSRAVKPITLREAHWSSYPGGSITVRGEAAADAAGQIHLEPDPRLGRSLPDQPVQTAVGKRTPFSFSLTVPADAELGTYPLRVALQTARGAVGVAGGMLRLRPPVAIRSVQPGRAGAARVLRLRLADATGQGAAGRVTTRLKGVPDTTAQATFKLPANGEAELLLDCHPTLPPGRVVPAVVTVQLDSGYRFEQEFAVNFLEAAQLTAPPTLASPPPATDVCELRGREALVRSPQAYRGTSDLAAQVRLYWDAKALYLLADVTDDTVWQPNTGFDTWKGDCLQVAFDLDPGKAAADSGNQLADAGSRHRASEIDLALTKAGPEAYRTVTFEKDRLPVRQLTAAELTLTARPRDGGMVYLAAIPWATLGLAAPPAAGARLGVAVAVNDMDDAQQLDPKAVGLFGGITPAKDPAKFGVVVLGGAR